MPLLQQVQLGWIDNSVGSSVLAFHRRSRTVLLLRSEYFVSKVASPDLFKWTDVGQWLCPVGLPPMLSSAALESYDALAVLFGSASETHLFLFNLSMQLINVVEMTNMVIPSVEVLNPQPVVRCLSMDNDQQRKELVFGLGRSSLLSASVRRVLVNTARRLSTSTATGVRSAQQWSEKSFK